MPLAKPCLTDSHFFLFYFFFFAADYGSCRLRRQAHHPPVNTSNKKGPSTKAGLTSAVARSSSVVPMPTSHYSINYGGGKKSDKSTRTCGVRRHPTRTHKKQSCAAERFLVQARPRAYLQYNMSTLSVCVRPSSGCAPWRASARSYIHNGHN